jgi:hypothetical protein
MKKLDTAEVEVLIKNIEDTVFQKYTKKLLNLGGEAVQTQVDYIARARRLLREVEQMRAEADKTLYRLLYELIKGFSNRREGWVSYIDENDQLMVYNSFICNEIRNEVVLENISGDIDIDTITNKLIDKYTK